ncbi:MAG: glutamyl-tRNA(Gln) amidotransferase subunit C, aspartyl-tRNA(Asn)/glutamyl-tRNA (Gln) amidotransferase subunit C [Candidatus Peregrinibacteria bacterium GW2011_GWF2_43_17]|nr:MAG: glutamyl-tRNA(Gln) amidotransferase subunit C, aspartyl-tRNA(Asn)/glutamyl-tRNA (Gln) amidotransferase subunit C [Candidatus Peregrinibacteria bacterium GW2011_GWF2_43_17]HAU40375.1 Asp-tRNA(Asn)/Glu-tRNA(Gln) amidotransferase GatCAB subunit C [Candidatus Peregrinibacteria bacterium]
MSKISKQQVEKVAKLARVKLSEEEVEKFSNQLDKVFGYMDILNEVDTENVEPTAQVTGLKNVMREDEIENFDNKEDLLKKTPLEVEDGQIKVMKVL